MIFININVKVLIIIYLSIIKIFQFDVYIFDNSIKLIVYLKIIYIFVNMIYKYQINLIVNFMGKILLLLYDICINIYNVYTVWIN